ncbi:MAG: response regulator [Deltaproteobacteria bacterium]|nr:MAG: response regulator [Deltaproteobacteria bacterium]
MKFAEENSVVPLLKSKDGTTLGAVTAEPQNEQTAEELRILTGFPKVKLYVSTQPAVRALIQKLYRGDLRAFDKLEQAGPEQSNEFRVTTGEIPEEFPRGHTGRVVAEEEENGEPRPKTSSWTRAVESVREASLLSDNDYIETLAIMVGLLEMQTEHRAGHTARVARLVRAMSRAFELDERQQNNMLISAFLHDVGKRNDPHLTLLGISTNREHRKLAKRYHLTPARLFDAVHLPREVNRTLAHLYEFFDGTGLPEELSGDLIPLGARIIAVADAFDELVQNPNNLVGATLEPHQAIGRIEKEAGTLFDPQVVKALKAAIKTRPEQTQRAPAVLIADPSPDATSELELKLSAAGFQVLTARDSDDVVNQLGTNPPDAMIIDYALAPEDGLKVLKRARQVSRDCPIFLTAESPDPQVVTEAFKQDATDFLTKPFLPEVLVAKLQKELEKSRGESPAGQQQGQQAPSSQAAIVIEVEDSPQPVEQSSDLPSQTSVTISMGGTQGSVISGSLEGKRALSLMRALAAKRRSGLLVLRKGKNKGEVHFNGGHIFQAIVGEAQGEEAFLELASWQDCLYRFDSKQQPSRRVIMTPTVKLLQIAKLMS